MMVAQQADKMANPEHLAKLKEGVEAWNAWRSGHPQIKIDLSESNLQKVDLQAANLSEAIIKAAGSEMDLVRANLDGADLRYARLDGTDLTKANLRNANLGSASLHDAHLSGADLSEANLIFANLSSADLSGARLTRTSLILADLTHANLNNAMLNLAGMMGTSLTGAQLSGTDLTGTGLAEAVFADVDLSTVRGLETVHHGGPSTIGIDTLYRSGGRIPESFLRGCGVPDEFITFAKSLVTNPIQFYSCFISYSTKDQPFADRLYADLQNKGVRCWFAPHDVQGGRKLHEQIDEAIRLHDKLLLILSPHSMESEWVKTEIAKARKREVRDQRRVLFPIRLAPFETLRDWECFDADTGKDSAREIREYFIPDFSNWKNHDSYEEAFQRLISDLKASDAKPK